MTCRNLNKKGHSPQRLTREFFAGLSGGFFRHVPAKKKKGWEKSFAEALYQVIVNYTDFCINRF
jgi:hypothetical protein